MTWWQFSLRCPAAELDQVEALLQDLGALSISLADARDDPIYEPLPGNMPVWPESIVTGTFDAALDPERLQQDIRLALPENLAASLRQDRLQEQDWEHAYRQHFRPLKCAPGLWILPSWCDPPDPGATLVRLDPGMAFGTGWHATTAMCLSWLAEQSLAGSEFIDYGCGSGILAIAACKLGAQRIRAVDIDPQALSACAENLRVNRVEPERVDLCAPADLEDTPADLLVANILAGPLIELAPRFTALVKPGGQIFLSGILKSQVNGIQSAYRSGFALDSPCYRDDWGGLGGTRAR